MADTKPRGTNGRFMKAATPQPAPETEPAGEPAPVQEPAEQPAPEPVAGDGPAVGEVVTFRYLDPLTARELVRRGVIADDPGTGVLQVVPLTDYTLQIGAGDVLAAPVGE